jgi:hypothetical protein
VQNIGPCAIGGHHSAAQGEGKRKVSARGRDGSRFGWQVASVPAVRREQPQRLTVIEHIHAQHPTGKARCDTLVARRDKQSRRHVDTADHVLDVVHIPYIVEHDETRAIGEDWRKTSRGKLFVDAQIDAKGMTQHVRNQAGRRVLAD